MNTTTSFNDQRLDQLLHALAHTPAPVGLEQRISARLAQDAAAATSRNSLGPSRLFVPKLHTSLLRACAFAAAAILLTAVSYRVLNRPQQPVTDTQVARTLSATGPALIHTPETTSPHTRPHAPTVRLAQPPADDPDTIALAETLAPSRPAPPLPLTTQEALLLRATRHGQPIEVAELETRRNAALTAIAAARERANIREYIHGLLGPLAIAESLSNTSSQSDSSNSVASAESPSSH